MPQRNADAAHIAPYLTHVVTHHGQLTLIPPENAGRVRQAKPKKNKASKQERKSRQEENSRPETNVRPRVIRASQPSSTTVSRRSGARNSFNQRRDQIHSREDDYSDAPPDYQEAISSPPLSVCPSTATLIPGFHSQTERATPLSFPIPLSSEVNLPNGGHAPVSDVVNSDSDSDESLEIVDSQIDVDHSPRQTSGVPPLEPEHMRGRAALDLDADDAPLTPTLSTFPKRRHASLSPLRTLFPHKPVQLQERALSAHSASPYSFPRNTNRFRSTTSLKTVSTGSFFRLPLCSPSSTSLARTEKKSSSKGKERTAESLDSWEMLDSEPHTSLMSAVESFTNPPSPDSGSPSPTQNPVFTYEQLPSSSTATLLDRKPKSLPRGQTTSPTSGVSASYPHSQSSSNSAPISYLRNPDTSPPSPSSRKQLTNSSPLSSQSRDAGHRDKPELSGMPNILQLAVETPLPPTPIERTFTQTDLYRSRSHVPESPHSTSVRSNMPTNMPYAMNRRSVKPTPKPIPSPLQLPFPSGAPSSSSHGPVSATGTLTQTPSRRHYPGRPLPQPPQLPPSPILSSEVARNMVDSLYAPHVDARAGPSSHPGTAFAEGLLIDFDEATPVHSTLGSEMNSPTSTICPSEHDRHPSEAVPVRDSEDAATASSTRSSSSNRLDGDDSLPSLDYADDTESQSDLVETATSSVEDLSAQTSSHNATTIGLAETYSNLTELDVLLSRLEENEQQRSGLEYDTLHLISEIMGPARHNRSNDPSTSREASPPLVGRIFLDRRRVTKAGKVRVKLSLLDVSVDKCGICLTQFKEKDLGAMSASCRHVFHERCLRRWLTRSRTCPLCRVSLGMFRSESVGQ